jgi:GT2 family glycosyltransferase
VTTPFMLQLNNDVEAIESGWLDQMVGWLAVPEVGVVGAKLLYPDGSIQHAGVMVMPSHGTPEHLFHRLFGNDSGYQWLPHRARNVSAVTGACLLTRTDLFHQLGGFDEEHLAVQFNDVDYCLKAVSADYRIVYEPAAVLFHRAGASRGRAYDYRENVFFLRKHREYRDPFLSPHLDLSSLCGPTPVLDDGPD